MTQTTEEVTRSVLAGVRVVEHSRGVMGAYCGRLFADLGADVALVRAADRTLDLEPPFLDDGSSLLAAHLDAGKRTLAAGEVGAAVAAADVLIDDAWPDPAPWVGAHPPAAVVVGLSGFGRTGPRAGWRGGELVAMGAGGIAYVTGRADHEPLKLAGHPFECLAAIEGLIGALAVLRERPATGRGRMVDVALADVVASNQEFDALYAYLGITRRRSDSPVPILFGHFILRCADGYLNVGTPTVRYGETLGLWLEDYEVQDDPRFESAQTAALHRAEVEARIAKGIAHRTRQELFDFGMELRMLCGPVATPDEVAGNPQLAARRFWQPLALPDGRTIDAPGPPVRIWQAAGPAATVAPKPPAGGLPLAGVRVIDFTLAYAGPTATRFLAELGADVIRVSSIQYPARSGELRTFPDNDPGPDPWNRTGYYVLRYLGKREVTLDLRDPRGRALFERLLATADVLVENHSPRALNNLGLSYAAVCERFPSLVMVSMSAFGQEGPWANYGGMGDTVEALGGMSDATGYRGGPPERAGMTYLDPISGALGAAGALLGLAHRARTGRGCYIDNSMFEAAVGTFPEAALAGAAGVPGLARMGAQHASLVPHNYYRCAGADDWIGIAVDTDAGWCALRTALGIADDARFATRAGRAAHRDAIDAAVQAAVAARDRHELSATLQAAGVAAAPVQGLRETYADAGFRARGRLQEVDHPEFGPRTWFRQFAGIIDGHDLRIPRPSPKLGEDNRAILQGELGVTEREFEELWAAEVIGDTPVADSTPHPLDLDTVLDYEGMADRDPDYCERQRL